MTATLSERGKRYGVFADQASYGDRINEVYHSSPNWQKMKPDQREALRLVANKIARILNGDFDYADSWHDIAGYATLVDKRLTEAAKPEAGCEVVSIRPKRDVADDIYDGWIVTLAVGGDWNYTLRKAADKYGVRLAIMPADNILRIANHAGPTGSEPHKQAMLRAIRDAIDAQKAVA